MIGKTVGAYKITDIIGSGGMGDVFVGEDLMLERQVAIKQLKPELASRADVVERFRSEAVILAKLQHPNIAMVYAFIQEGASFFLVMEYIQGWTLQHILKVAGVLAPTVTSGLFTQILTGIGFAHQRHIIHRDVKPANIMLTESGVVKLMDFGLARVLGSAHLTQKGRLVGTLEYISPEQIRGEETDARSDIYSLGVVLYELITGRLPFESDSEYELVRAQVETQPSSPQQIMPFVSSELDQAILRALAKTPAERFQSAEEFALALATCLPNTGAPIAVLNLLTILKTSALTSTPKAALIQETRHASQRDIASAQVKTTRLATGSDRDPTPLPAASPLRARRSYLVPACILAFSVAVAGFLFFLGVHDVPNRAQRSSISSSEIVSPATPPLPAQPPGRDERAMPMPSTPTHEPWPSDSATISPPAETTTENPSSVDAVGSATGRLSSKPSGNAVEEGLAPSSDDQTGVEEALNAAWPQQEPHDAPLAVGAPPDRHDKGKNVDQHGSSNRRKSLENTRPKSSSEKIPLDQEIRQVESPLQTPKPHGTQATSSDIAVNAHEPPVIPTAKKENKGSGGWYIKK